MSMTSIQLPADWLPRISIFWLKQHGYLDHSQDGWYMQNEYKIQIITIIQDFGPYLYLVYVDNEGIATIAQKINLIRTPCRYGGWRFWFQCPRPRSKLTCGRRIGVLHAYKGVFGCRECLGMTYSCRQRNTKSPLQEYARIIRAEHKLQNLGLGRRRLRYKGKPTKYSRELRKIHNELVSLSEKEIDI